MTENGNKRGKIGGMHKYGGEILCNMNVKIIQKAVDKIDERVYN